jgi:DNA-binding transcriptional regulator/RsmH inhibitor MraZ
MRDGRNSTEILRRRDGDVLLADEEYAILDRAGRLQLPEAFIDALDMEDRVRLRLQEDRVEVFPQDETENEAQPETEQFTGL